MTASAESYLRHIRALSPDELSRWRHELDRAERLKPSRLHLVQEHWQRLVADRIGPMNTHDGSGRLEAS